MSDGGLTWRRAKDRPTLSVSDADCGAWEKSCIYQPWLLEHENKFYDFYNAAQGGVEQTGLAFSTDLLSWKRYSDNPVIHVRPKGYDERFASDPKVFRDGDHWVMFYFGLCSDGHARDLVAFSDDLRTWRKGGEVLIDVGGEGSIDSRYAHKPGIISRDGRLYHFYCAVSPSKGRCPVNMWNIVTPSA